MRVAIIALAALLTSCEPSHVAKQEKPDPVKESWYAPAVEELTTINREAEKLFAAKKQDEASALITKGQPIANRVISVPRPTLEAMAAASDLDDLYGRMLLSNKHYGWARMFFQKNVARWRNWQPQTDEVTRRRKQAEASMAECDRRLGL